MSSKKRKSVVQSKTAGKSPLDQNKKATTKKRKSKSKSALDQSVSQSAWQDPHAAQEAARYASPIPSRVFIEQTLQQYPQPLGHGDLMRIFKLTDQDAATALERRLIAMVRDGQIQASGQPPLYQPLNPDRFKTGPVQVHPRGFGFVILQNESDIWLGERDLSQIFHGDIVKVTISGTNHRGQPIGRLVEVVQREAKQLIGRIAQEAEQFYLQPPFPNQHQPITLDNAQVTQLGLAVGDSAQVVIEEWPSREHYATGRITQDLSDRAETQLIVPTTLIDMDIPHVFSGDILTETSRFKEPNAKDRKGREDLRELPLVTIDGEDARDFDDAVYAEKRPGGGYRLVVAIADVSHYVKPGTALDTEALARGTSVYFPNQVVPMLPETLSNGLCSLKPEVDRLCMVCDIQVTRLGRVKSYTFYPAVMHSHARLTYGQVAVFLQSKDQVADAIAKQPAVRKSLQVLNQLHELMLQKRDERGAMEFETTETYMQFDDVGAITSILPRTRNIAHRLIEECMLLANVCAADFALKHELPVLYRNHEMPESSRIQKVRDYMRTLGLTFPEKPTQQDYQAVIEATRDRPDAPSIHAVLLRSMMQAYYGPENTGHYGLAYDAYAHFTSPIRRYPDLLLHRAIKAQVTANRYALDADKLAAAGEHLSQTERRADEASRSVQAWLKCHYMQGHIGESFDGVITAVTEFGLFVTLQALYVEGLIHVRTLGQVVHDFLQFDPATQTLTGRGQGKRFGLGDRVRVLVAGVSLDERKIDFEFVSKLSADQPQAALTNNVSAIDAPTARPARQRRSKQPSITPPPDVSINPVESVPVSEGNETASPKPARTRQRKPASQPAQQETASNDISKRLKDDQKAPRPSRARRKTAEQKAEMPEQAPQVEKSTALINEEASQEVKPKARRRTSRPAS